MSARATRVRFVDLQAQIASLQPALGAAMARAIERGDFILGEDVDAFEREFAAFCGVKHAVGVDSGLSALELALRGARIGPGDEVITQANTFIATVGAILAVGARPVLVDCDPWGEIDPAAVERAITSRTRAIMPVHLFGKICAIERLVTLGRQADIPVIEDACQAHGAAWQGRRAGSFGLAGAFSFYPAKNLGGFGDGGMLVTNSDEVAEHARTLRNYGAKVKYEHLVLPMNHRLDTIQAAVLRVKLPHLDGWNARRESLAGAYRQRLRSSSLIVPPPAEPGRHVYHLFVVGVTDVAALQQALRGKGIETGRHYPIPLHRQPVLQDLGYQWGAFPNAERLAEHSLSLPMYPELSTEQLEFVVDAIAEFTPAARAA